MGGRLRAGIPSRYVTSQLGQLSLHPSGVAESSTSFGWGNDGNVTSAGWQVTLCDPMWHVSSRSGVATLRTAIHLLVTYLLTYLQTFTWNVFVQSNASSGTRGVIGNNCAYLFTEMPTLSQTAQTLATSSSYISFSRDELEVWNWTEMNVDPQCVEEIKMSHGNASFR